MWFGLWPSMDRHPDVQKFNTQGPVIVGWDVAKGPDFTATTPAPKREYTVARSTRAMPERRKL